MDQAKKTEYRDVLLSLIPESGTSIGNSTLRDQFRGRIGGDGETFSDQDYWQLRDLLIDEGLIGQGRGRGGSVHRLIVATAPQTPLTAPSINERSLYAPFGQAIISGYVKDNRIKRFIWADTASGGPHRGQWTRPDFTLIAVRTYAFTPGKRLEVITFEVKPSLDTAFQGIFEALAHSVFAHRSYLAVNVSNFAEDSEIPDDRIVQECERLQVGYIRFGNVADYNTYDIVHSPEIQDPDPYEVDTFITAQVTAEKQEELRDWLR